MAALSPLALQATPSSNFANKLSQTRELLRRAVEQHPRITQASSLGAEDVVVTHLLELLHAEFAAAAQPFGADVFVFNTGKLHTQTVDFLTRSQAASPLTWRVFEPVQTDTITFVKTYGELAMRESVELRKRCCHIRKVEPLARALTGYSAWITGVRAEQSQARSGVSAIDMSEPNITKYNPLVDWTWGDVLHYILTFGVPYNPLHDQFYSSIGCEPCTRAISLGEDFRAGRWWWEGETTKECGLHVR